MLEHNCRLANKTEKLNSMMRNLCIKVQDVIDKHISEEEFQMEEFWSEVGDEQNTVTQET